MVGKPLFLPKVILLITPERACVPPDSQYQGVRRCTPSNYIVHVEIRMLVYGSEIEVSSGRKKGNFPKTISLEKNPNTNPLND